MAVEIKYVVVRGGVEKMTFASKKEADAYDKLLDTADELMTLLAGAPVQLAPEQQESLAFYLAEQRDLLQNVLRGSSVGYGAAQLSLADIGIQRDTASGKLSIDQTTLGKAFAANPENATQLLSNVATGLQDIAARNTGNTSELQTNTRQLQQTLQNIGVQRSLLYNYDELQVNGMQADSLSSLLNYLPSYSLTSPIARYLAVAGL